MKARAGVALDRQQLAISPQVFRTLRDRLPGHRPGRNGVVVDDLERAQAFVAHPQRFGRKAGLAKMTAKTEDHRGFFSSDPQIWSHRPSDRLGWPDLKVGP